MDYYKFADLGFDKSPDSTPLLQWAVRRKISSEDELYIIGELMGLDEDRIWTEIDYHTQQQAWGMCLRPPMDGILHGFWCSRAKDVTVAGIDEGLKDFKLEQRHKGHEYTKGIIKVERRLIERIYKSVSFAHGTKETSDHVVLTKRRNVFKKN